MNFKTALAALLLTAGFAVPYGVSPCGAQDNGAKDAPPQKGKITLAAIYETTPFSANPTNFNEVEKLFSTPDAFLTLSELTEKEVETAKNLHDFNRFPKILKPRLEEKPGFFHPSAAAPQEEDESVTAVAEKPVAAKTSSAVTPCAAIAITSESVNFFVKGDASPNALVEFHISPREPGRFGNGGLSFVLNQTTGAITLLTPPYDGTINPNNKFERQVLMRNRWTTPDGGVINTVSVPWQAFYRLTGDFPLKENSRQIWNLGIFRWTDGKCHTLRGTPYERGNNTFLMTPQFRAREITSVKAKMFSSLLAGYYVDNMGKGNEFNAYFDAMTGHYNSAPRWQKYFGVPKRLAFTHFFSNYYMCDSKDFIENYKQETLKIAQDAKELLENQYAVDLILKYDYERFMMREKEREKLRFKAMSDRVFSSQFTME